MHKMICTFKAIVCPPSPMDHQAKLQTFFKKKRALELGRTSVLTWQTHPCPGHTHQVLCLGAVYPSSHMVEAPHNPHEWGGEAGSSSSPHMNEERVVVVVITPHIIPMLTYINASWLFVFVHIDLVPILWGNTFVFILLCFGSILKQTLTHEIHH